MPLGSLEDEPVEDEPAWMADFNWRMQMHEDEQTRIPSPRERSRSPKRIEEDRIEKKRIEENSLEEIRIEENREQASLKRHGDKLWEIVKKTPGRIIFKLMCPRDHKPFAFEYACDTINAMSAAREYLGYKIGVTRDAEHRWSNREYGYSSESGCCMVILHSTDYDEATLLESLLIMKFRSRPRNANKAVGGGGISRAGGPVLLYLVFGRFN